MTAPLPSSASSAAEHPLLSEARRIGPQLSVRSDEIESARHLPEDLARQLADAGFFRMVLPEVYGGLELHPARLVEIVEELARADASVGWCVMINACTAMLAAWLPESAARAIFSAPGIIVGGVAAPTGRAELVEGGYRLTGRWSWASGSHNCHWMVGGALVTKDGAPRMVREGVPEVRSFCFPISDATLHDTWHAMGLCGTGSGDMSVQDLFVPAERSFSLMEPPRLKSPLYTFPALGLLGLGLPAVGLGIARRAVDELHALAQVKKLMPVGRLLAARPAVQESFAEAEATLRAARALLMETVNTTFASSSRGQEMTVRHRADLRLSYAHAMR
ncbi:MAG: acyl-CoA dehydrogenase family protein, partial [Cystobacter sp.]